MSNYIVGLTGGIGSGKTTISDIFAQLNIDIIDADIVARQVVEPNTPALKAIKAHFGADFITDEQQLDRRKLRQRVFSHPEDKAWLNNLLHPLIREEMLRQLKQAQSRYCILVAPLLLENGLEKMVDRVLVIDVDQQTQIKRVQHRDNNTEAEVKGIIANQISREKRLAAADDVINNQHLNNTEIKNIVNKLHQQYLKYSCDI